MNQIDPDRVRAELSAIRGERNSEVKGRRLEALIRDIFCRIPGLSIEDQDVENAFHTQEMDLYFLNSPALDGLYFLDCPLIIECKGWSDPVSGREIRYFADLLKDKGRRNGIFVALNGITGNPNNFSAGFYHVTTALASGQLVLVITGDDLANACEPSQIVALLQRRMLDQVKGQVLAIGAGSVGVNVRGKKNARSTSPGKAIRRISPKGSSRK